MRSRYGLNDKIRSGKYAGRTPRSLIKGSIDEIEYLLWWRDQKSSKGYPVVLFGMDVHHALDQILRVNPEKFPGHKPKFSAAEFDIYIAEQRLKHKKEKEEAAAKEQAERLQREAAKREQQEKHRMLFEAREAKRLAKAVAEKERELAYVNTWGAWT